MPLTIPLPLLFDVAVTFVVIVERVRIGPPVGLMKVACDDEEFGTWDDVDVDALATARDCKEYFVSRRWDRTLVEIDCRVVDTIGTLGGWLASNVCRAFKVGMREVVSPGKN